MKKAIALFLILCLMVSIAACSGNAPAPTTSAATEATTEAPTEETFPDPVDKLDPSAVVGQYADLTSQRAELTITFDDDTELYTFQVSWANSAFETAVWTMHCADAGVVQFPYTDCVYKLITYAEDGTVTEAIQYENGTGYFTYDYARFLWDGAAEDSCKACVFEQLPPMPDMPPQKGDPMAVIGEYMDMTSQRARMTLDYDFDQDIYIAEVSWANSASEEEVWRMHWTDMGDGLYTYDDCQHLRISYAENGEATITVLSENGVGYFSYYFGHDLRVTDNGILDRFLWDGAEDENCRACVFEQMG